MNYSISVLFLLLPLLSKAQGVPKVISSHIEMEANTFTNGIPVDTAIAIYASAKGGAGSNWAAYFDQGNVKVNGLSLIHI